MEIKSIGIVSLVVIVVIVLFSSLGSVGAGERGVKTRFGNVVGEVEPGLYFKLPFIEGVNKTDIQTQKVQQDTTAASSDLQDVKATIAVNFAFSDDFNKAIEAKVTAEQNALAAKNKLDQVQFEAQQTVATAKAQAEAIQIQTQAINSQGGANYVQLEAIKKWDGKLPASMIPGSAVPFINLTK